MFARVLAVGLAFGPAAPTSAGLVPGGGSRKSDCYIEFDVAGWDKTSNVVTCAEGTDACDTDGLPNDICDFKVALCPNQTDPNLPSCTPHPPLTGLKVKVMPKSLPAPPPPADRSGTTCGTAVDIMVPPKRDGTKVKMPRKAVIMVKATGSGRPKKDWDRLSLVCGSCVGCPLPCPTPNPAGGPDVIEITVAESGTDLDIGWMGTAHNFPLPGRSSLRMCLSGCDASTNPMCDAIGPTGVGSVNTATFGPPLPLIAQGVPFCVINLFKDNPTAKINVQTGEILPDNPLAVNLTSKVHLTRPDQVCPRCKGSGAPTLGATGTCDGGANQGQACTIDSIVNVAQAQGSPVYPLSKQCPPLASQFVPNGALDLKLRLTTGTSSLQGPKPCMAMQDDDCQGTPCNATCTGSACVKMVPDPVTGDMVCQDVKGGLSQLCCAGSTTRPCFPTAGGGSIMRTGRPDAPAPVWPDPTYPKTSTKGVLVTTFCEGATTAGTIDATAGLPAPGALILPVTQVLLKVH